MSSGGAKLQLALKRELITGPHLEPPFSAVSAVHKAIAVFIAHGVVERMIRTLKEQCVLSQRFESLTRASRAIGDWIDFSNHQRAHQGLGMKTPAETYALAA